MPSLFKSRQTLCFFTVNVNIFLNMLINKWKSDIICYHHCMLKFSLCVKMHLKIVFLENFKLILLVCRYCFVFKTLWSSGFHCNIRILVSLPLSFSLPSFPSISQSPLCVYEWDLRPLSRCQSHALTHIPRRHTIDIWQIALCVWVWECMCVF